MVGMPWSGKSTIARQLASSFDMPTVDTDDLIEAQIAMPIQQYIDQYGVNAFKLVEDQYLSTLSVSGHVIATGGSAIYADAGMRNLSTGSQIVYLQVSLETLLSRSGDLNDRGLVRESEQGLESLYHERVPLYERWADIVIDNNESLDQSRLLAIRELVVEKGFEQAN